MAVKTALAKKSTIRFPRTPREIESIMGKALAWFSRCGRYRIIRFPEFESGVARYYVAWTLGACPISTKIVWCHCENHRGPCRKLGSAVKACSEHDRLCGEAFRIIVPNP